MNKQYIADFASYWNLNICAAPSFSGESLNHISLFRSIFWQFAIRKQPAFWEFIKILVSIIHVEEAGQFRKVTASARAWDRRVKIWTVSPKSGRLAGMLTYRTRKRQMPACWKQRNLKHKKLKNMHIDSVLINGIWKPRYRFFGFSKKTSVSISFNSNRNSTSWIHSLTVLVFCVCFASVVKEVCQSMQGPV